MKKSFTLILALLITLTLLPGCDVISALEITPSPSPATGTAPPFTTAPAQSKYPAGEIVVFKDPEVEKTIRAKLGKGDITTADMLRVTSFEYNLNRKSMDVLSTLDDLRWCKNLKTIYVEYQKGITSIEPLRELDTLMNVDISGCSVSDLTPLADKESLRELMISETPVADASPVLSLPSLETFYVFSGTNISDISALSLTHSLKVFSCRQRRLNDYTPLLGHKGLEVVMLRGITDEYFRELLANCRNLRDIWIIDSDIKDESLSLLKDFRLHNLLLDNCGIKDISDLASLPCVQGLDYLGIQNNLILDLSPLENLKNLKNLNVSGNPYKVAFALNALEWGGCKVTR